MLGKRECIDDTPPWLRELRLKKRNRQLQQQHSNQSECSSPPALPPHHQQAFASSSAALGTTTVQQPPPPALPTAWHCHGTHYGNSASATEVGNGPRDEARCNNHINHYDNDMVQERTQLVIEKIAKSGDDSDEELKYGPGIVSKLKNRYLSLTLREAASKNRPSILQLRKATSLEHILDDYDEKPDVHRENGDSTKTERLFLRHNGAANAKSTTNRYQNRNASKSDMKRARSVEIISDIHHDTLLTNATDAKSKQRESLHEEMLVIEGNGEADKSDKTFQIEENRNFSNNIGIRLNRPRKIQPVMNEKEKPHPDIVREKKKLFERPELRTKPPQPTGEVAAKVAGFRTIIDSNKKPPIKQKPVIAEKFQIKRQTSAEQHSEVKRTQIGSPIPPLRSPVKENKAETIPDVSEINGFPDTKLCETPDLLVHSSPCHARTEEIENFLKAEKEHGIVEEKNRINLEKNKGLGRKEKSPEEPPSKGSGSNSVIYSFGSPTKIKDHLPRLETQNLEKPKAIKQKTSPTKQAPGQNQQNTSPTKQLPREIQQKLSPTKQVPTQIQRTSSPTKQDQNQQKMSHTKQVPSQNQQKTSPTKQTASQNQQKISPTKQKPSPTKEPTSPTSNMDSVRQNLFPKSENGVSISDPLKIEVETKPPPIKKRSTPPIPQQQKQITKTAANEASDARNNSTKLSDKVIEKNLINKLNGGSVVKENGAAVKNEVPAAVLMPKKKSAPKKEQQNSLVFDFTNRKDVPDYVGNDGSIKPKEKMRPKVR